MKLRIDRFKRWMKEQGFTQTSLADALSLSRKYVNRCLAGEAMADTLLGRVKARYPMISVDYFIDDEGAA